MVTIVRRAVRARRKGSAVRLRMNATGRRLLRAQKRLSVVVTWKATGQDAVTVRRTIRVRR